MEDDTGSISLHGIVSFSIASEAPLTVRVEHLAPGRGIAATNTSLDVDSEVRETEVTGVGLAHVAVSEAASGDAVDLLGDTIVKFGEGSARSVAVDWETLRADHALILVGPGVELGVAVVDGWVALLALRLLEAVIFEGVAWLAVGADDSVLGVRGEVSAWIGGWEEVSAVSVWGWLGSLAELASSVSGGVAVFEEDRWSA